MSDNVVIAFIVGFFGTATTLLTIVLNSIAHKEINSKLSRLVIAEKALSHQEGKDDQKAEDKSAAESKSEDNSKKPIDIVKEEDKKV